MGEPIIFEEFLSLFFELFSKRSFGGKDYLTYLAQPPAKRRGDEASVVDTAVVGPLLGLLGFEPGERVYNQQRQSDRPDFAPRETVYGTCFLVEDKATAIPLNFDTSDADSHLSQLMRYVQRWGLLFGWLTNGQQFTIWRFDDPKGPIRIVDFDIPTAIQDWSGSAPQSLPAQTEKGLRDLFDLCRQEAFSDLKRLRDDICIPFSEWIERALPLGTGDGHESTLVESVQWLIEELQRDARRILDEHLRGYDEYSARANRSSDDADEQAVEELKVLRNKTLQTLDQYRAMLGLGAEEGAAIAATLEILEQGATAFQSPHAVLERVLKDVNAARQRKYASAPRAARVWTNLDELPLFKAELERYTDIAFALHQRRATLRQSYRATLGVHEDYVIWGSLMQETMLGGLSEEERRDEFALQAAYVVFIRLLLVRICEDKGVFPQRMVSDGGLAHWQEDIKRYLAFANGNPYTPLLDMAYANAQNIYAHFFSGRELFNWYHPDERRILMALHRLNRFNLAGVDSDIIGTIYSTYISREEKKNKGQYYTPREIVSYILDEVGYRGTAIIGGNKRLIDPACGSGSFLVAAAKRLVGAYTVAGEKIEDPVAVLQRVQNTLYGFDLNPFSCYLAEVNLLIQALDLVKLAHDRGKRPKIGRFHVYNVDALSRSTGTRQYLRFNTLLAEESDVVDQIKARSEGTPYAQGFAFVVANPPYGARLSAAYKEMLRADWPDVFYGQPDTYVFFMKLGVELLAKDGRLGFITPNTYLMGTHTARLRGALLEAGEVEEVVDLPQGIWPDANVDCALLFLKAEGDREKREAHLVEIHMLGLRDTLDKLVVRDWSETFTQPQSEWAGDPKHEMNIRQDRLLQQIEDACRVPVGANGAEVTKVLRLGDVTDSSQGIIPYKTKAEGAANLYIRPRRSAPLAEGDWKPLLESSGFVGRYELRWGSGHPHLKYGDWLWCERESKYFDSPKLLVQDMRNRALKRRLVATYDDQQFYNRHNFSNIIAEDEDYDLKYLLALFNSSLLNYWFARKYDNLHINPSYFRQLPVYPAGADEQAAIGKLVDEILVANAELNRLREAGYVIRQKRDGNVEIAAPYGVLLAEMQRQDRGFASLTLFDARAAGLFSIPARCDLGASISSNVFVPSKQPTSVVLRHNKLWFEVPDDDVRRYLAGYLSGPEWAGKTWDEIKNVGLVPEGERLREFFEVESRKIGEIRELLQEVKRVDAEIDDKVLDLYGITDGADRQRVLGSAPVKVEEEQVEVTSDE